MSSDLEYGCKDIFIIPLSISILLLVWFYEIQDGSIMSLDSIYNLVIFNGYIATLEYSIYRTISHINTNHLFNNIINFIICSTALITIQRVRYVIIEFILAILFCMLYYTQYPNAVGFSGVIYSIYTICIFSYIFIFLNVDIKSISDADYFIIIVNLFFVLYMTIQITIDILFYIGYKDMIQLVISIPDNYVLKTSEIHLIGFIIGIYIICTIFYASSYLKIDMFKL